MSVSRREFYSDARQMLDLAKNPLLVDTFPPNAQQNISARILRRGLAVSAFSLPEGYMEKRLEELVFDLSASPISYSDMGSKLKRFLTVETVLGFATKLNFTKNADQLQLAEDLLARLIGHMSVPPSYTAIGFSPKGSNISKDDIKTALAALGADDGWTRLSRIARDIGSTRLSLEGEYANLANIRNRAAHDSAVNVPTTDLQAHLEVVNVIGITFDIMCSSLVSTYLKARTPAHVAAGFAILAPSYRFIDHQVDGRWFERAKTTGRVVKSYSTELEARTVAGTRTGGGFIVIRDIKQLPIELL